MSEVEWLPGVIALVGGLGAGVLLALVVFRNSRRNNEASDGTANLSASDQRIRDLEEQKSDILRDLRSLHDQRGAAPMSGTQEEMRQLELRAARILQQLDALQAGTSELDGAEDESVLSQRPASDVQPARQANATFGAVKWAAIGAFFPIVAFSLYLSTSERGEGMVMTGAPLGAERPDAPSAAPAPIPPGEPGAPVQNVPPALQPRPSAAVDRARAAVAAQPGSVEAWSELGYALVDAEGWIDAFETSRQILTMSPGNPDGLLVHAIVRIAMGQRELAQDLVTEALTTHPSHVRGLMYQGMLAMQRGDREAAHTAWTRGLNTAGPGQGFEELLALPSPSDGPQSPVPGMQAPHPSAATQAGTAAKAGPGPAAPSGGESDPTIRGVLHLADGASAPPGGVVFVIARPVGVQGGPPAAVRRLPAVSFPMVFELGPGDAMLGGPFPAEVTLSVRLDADGNATSRSPQDLVAAPVQAKAGSSGLELVLTSAP